MNTTIIGIDPGVIHTGCVALAIDNISRTIEVNYAVISGVDTSGIEGWLATVKDPAIFVEDYNPSNYAREDKKMSEALGRLKATFPSSDDPIVRYVDNAGINTLVPVAVQQIFGIHKFPVTTHHNDLNSAGKIALLGMLQDKGPDLRNLISLIVVDAIASIPWAVKQHV